MSGLLLDLVTGGWALFLGALYLVCVGAFYEDVRDGLARRRRRRRR